MFKKLVICLALCATVKANVHSGNIVDSQEQFSNDYFKQVKIFHKGNFVTSPLSLYTALSMIAFGAGGQTADQIKKCLRLKDELVYELGIYIQEIGDVRSATLNVANAIYVSDRLALKHDFQNMMKNIFRNEVESANFNDVDKIVRRANQWTSEKTRNKIKDILSEGDITAHTRMILLNAVYFKARWAKPFDKDMTQLSYFVADDDTVKTVITMVSCDEYDYGYLSEFHARFIILPYENKDLKMIIIVPFKSEVLNKIEDNVHKFTDVYFAEKAMSYKLRVMIPKFKIESTINLEGPLKKMGMTDMFNNQTADFTNISDELLQVEKIIQKAYIEVDEEGTEAAAETEMLMESRAGTPEFTVDGPFYYVIKSSQGILFQGRVVDPTL